MKSVTIFCLLFLTISQITCVDLKCSSEQFCKTCSTTGACTDCHDGYYLNTNTCVAGAVAGCEIYNSGGTCMCCKYPLYFNGSSCMRFPAGGYLPTPGTSDTYGYMPDAQCGCYYYNGIGTATLTTASNSVVYGTTTQVQP